MIWWQQLILTLAKALGPVLAQLLSAVLNRLSTLGHSRVDSYASTAKAAVRYVDDRYGAESNAWKRKLAVRKLQRVHPDLSDSVANWLIETAVQELKHARNKIGTGYAGVPLKYERAASPV